MCVAQAASLAAITEVAAPMGLAPGDACGVDVGDGAPEGCAALVLLGLRGPAAWDVFQASPEASDRDPHPLDRWSARLGRSLAARFGAQALFPFEGPPYYPFLSWTGRAERAWPSPLGMYIHAERGLWLSVRAALALPTVPNDLSVADVSKPCDNCAEKPCKTACPVNAFGPEGYDVSACAAHLRSDAGADCRNQGCLARRACPVGRSFEPSPEQRAFHMCAFLRAREAE